MKKQNQQNNDCFEKEEPLDYQHQMQFLYNQLVDLEAEGLFNTNAPDYLLQIAQLKQWSNIELIDCQQVYLRYLKDTDFKRNLSSRIFVAVIVLVVIAAGAYLYFNVI